MSVCSDLSAVVHCTISVFFSTDKDEVSNDCRLLGLVAVSGILCMPVNSGTTESVVVPSMLCTPGNTCTAGNVEGTSSGFSPRDGMPFNMFDVFRVITTAAYEEFLGEVTHCATTQLADV